MRERRPSAPGAEHDARAGDGDDARGEQRHEQIRDDRVGCHEERPDAEDEDDAERDAPVVADDEVNPEAAEAAEKAHAHPPSAGSASPDGRSTRTADHANALQTTSS